MPKLNAKQLTDPGIAKLRKPPKGERLEVSDAIARGLVLRVTDRNVKSWAVYYRIAGDPTRKNRRLTLGWWPTMGVAVARIEAGKARDKASVGIDPDAEREAERSQQRDMRSRLLVENVAEDFIKAKAKLKRGAEIASVVRRHIVPAWKGRLITDIKRLDLSDLTGPLVEADLPGAANKLHEIAKGLSFWTVDKGLAEASPFARMKPPAEKEPRQVTLTHAELKRVWLAGGQVGYPFGPFVQLLLLTMQRRTEVGGMRWPELDLSAKLWTLPPERTKNGLAFICPLSPQAVAVIKGLPCFLHGDYLFSTASGSGKKVGNVKRHTGERPMSGYSKMKARFDEAAKVSKDWHLHDLRRTGRSELARLKIPDEVAERVLNHVPEKLVRTYNTFQYLDEKRDALELWGRELATITAPSKGKVVKLRKSA